MNLAQIYPAIDHIAENLILLDLHAAGYLSTYPHIRGHITRGSEVTSSNFLQLAAMTYGWMPRVLRVDRAHLAAAVDALGVAATANEASYTTVAVADIASCLRSVVGTSKMLHFVNDQIFPIWDSRIESFRIQAKPTNPHMSDPVNYLAFIRDVNAIRLEPSFQSFYTEFQAVYFDRQQAMGIPLYRISEVRAIEAAAFELA